MTEAEWLAGDNPLDMPLQANSGAWWRWFMPWTLDPRRPSVRRMRLLECAYYRFFVPLNERGDESRSGLSAAERYADGEITAEELRNLTQSYVEDWVGALN